MLRRFQGKVLILRAAQSQIEQKKTNRLSRLLTAPCHHHRVDLRQNDQHKKAIRRS